MSANGERGEAASSGGVVVIGRRSLQNRLLAGLIAERLGCACNVRTLDELHGTAFAPDTLALLDVEQSDEKTAAADLHALVGGLACCSVAIINADEGVATGEIVSWPGVKGMFFRDATHEQLLKGIQAIFGGEYWLPRSVLWAHLDSTRARRASGEGAAAALTPKETETLRLLVAGNSNSHIARRLSVSTHTVKSHLYNLFRKIRVKNRVQAVNWALQNIDGARGEPQ